jgi:RNA polymerase sigma-70 factor (ECF subfamily)
MSTQDGSAQRREARFTRLFAEAYGPVLGYARRRVGTDSAEDIVAEVFLTAWQHLDRAPPDPLPWLYRIAWHAIGNQRRGLARRQRLQQRAQGLAGPLHTGDHADEIVGREAIMAAFDALAEPDREVLRLICWEDLDPADAAQVLGCSTTALRVRLHRARRRLARLTESTPIPYQAQQATVASQETR